MDLKTNILIKDLGTQDYKNVWDFQKNLQQKIIMGKQPDTLLLVEHEPVYTMGKNGNPDHVLQNRSINTKIYQVERGGDITFHGPGQLVGYPILDLHHYEKSISWYMRTLETMLIRTLGHFGIEGELKKGLTGVWVEDEKIAALGVRISRWVTMHGFALNVNTDLEYYQSIIPCGIFEYGVTSMQELTGEKVDMQLFKDTVKAEFRNFFCRIKS
ncbi:MAG: lipoyl(octanoyl) transferase LipB [Candidatus Neomarinimicrobiota bacterium]